jgi:chorismate mutase / prephenate dehydratase
VCGGPRISIMTLAELREQIDQLDAQLLKLLNERADLVHQVGALKKGAGIEIYAPEREEQLLESLVSRNNGRLAPESIRAIYREIMSSSLALEKAIAIAYLGPEATWTHQAAREKFGASVRYLPQTDIGDVFDEVARRHADYGVVPVENSTEGAVSHTLDMFVESDLQICAQILLKIENHLLGHAPREKIAKLYSHPQVFGQCREWLRRSMPGVELIEVSSTTRAAEMAAQDHNAGALAGRLAAEVYHLPILEQGVQDKPDNTTRFLVIGHQSCPRTGNDRTSLMFGLHDKPGALFSALRPFDELKISLSKIESRPSRRKAWEYVFFVDIDGHQEDGPVVAAVKELKKHCSIVRILGSYPKTDRLPG